MVSTNNQQSILWFDKASYDDAERKHHERISRGFASPSTTTKGTSVASEIAKARQQIQNSLKVGGAGGGSEVAERVSVIEKENAQLREMCKDMSGIISKLEARLRALELKMGSTAPVASKPAPPEAASDEDDDVDLFGSDDEEESAEAQKIKEERLAAYAAKKAKKPALIAKSSVLLDVKPWDDETDMGLLEKHVRTIEMDGLLWGAAKLVPLAFGIKKLSIVCTVEDEKVSVEELSEKIEEFEDFVQSVDVAAFNKI